MKRPATSSDRLIRWAAGGTVVLALAAVIGWIYLGGLAGETLGPRETIRIFFDLPRAVAKRGEVLKTSRGEYTNVVFLHHSVGHNLIEQGGLRELFTQAGVEFWDQGYNNFGLRDPQGIQTGYAYPVPRDNTDTDGLAVIFAQKELGQPLNALSGLLQHEVIIIKSCFPNNHINSEQKLEDMKSMYQDMLATVDRHPEKLFIMVTSPPLNPAETNTEEAARAGQMASWLVSGQFSGVRSNLAVVDLFSLLAVSDPASPEANMLRPEYRQGSDSHPTASANQKIAPIFVESVITAIEQYREGL